MALTLVPNYPTNYWSRKLLLALNILNWKCITYIWLVMASIWHLISHLTTLVQGLTNPVETPQWWDHFWFAECVVVSLPITLLPPALLLTLPRLPPFALLSLSVLRWLCHGVMDLWLPSCVAAGQGRSLLSPASALCLCQSCQRSPRRTKKKNRVAKKEGGGNDRAGRRWDGQSERWPPDEGNE